MKVSEIKKLPQKAGVASLHFKPFERYNEYRLNTHRTGADIMLMTEPDSEFVPLLGGEQFLFTGGGVPFGGGVFFGGTDERPFLAPLDREMVLIYTKEGEAGFFEALKPRVVQELERQHGSRFTKRQGDIFAHPSLSPPLPASDRKPEGVSWTEWTEAQEIRELSLPTAHQALSWWEAIQLQQVIGWRFVGGLRGWQQIFGTRHFLQGESVTFERRGYGGGHNEQRVLMEGTLCNSDHAQLLLKGPHLMARTARISSVDPFAAD